MIYFIRYVVFNILMFFTLFLIAPVTLIRPFNTKNTHLYTKIFTFLCHYLCGIRMHITGREYVESIRPAIVVGNHQHNIDVLTVGSIFNDHTVILGKYELGFIPVFGQIYLLCGNILIKRGKRKEAMESMRMLEKKIKDQKLNVLIFPEGHRNQNKELLPFKKGAFYTAVNTQVPILPFSISQFVNHGVLNRFKMADVYIKIHPPISTEGKTRADIPELIQKTRDVIKVGIEEMNKNYG